MKKLVILAMIGMIFTSCSNDDLISTPKASNQSNYEKTIERSAPGVTKKEQEAIDLLKGSITGRLPGNSAYINCHTDYSAPSGHSCVSSGGYLFNVSWATPSSSSGSVGTTFWFSDQVSSCGC